MAHTRLRANKCAKSRTHGCQQNGIVAVRLLWFNRNGQHRKHAADNVRRVRSLRTLP